MGSLADKRKLAEAWADMTDAERAKLADAHRIMARRGAPTSAMCQYCHDMELWLEGVEHFEELLDKARAAGVAFDAECQQDLEATDGAQTLPSNYPPVPKHRKGQ